MPRPSRGGCNPLGISDNSPVNIVNRVLLAAGLLGISLVATPAFAADKISELKNAFPPCTRRPEARAEEQARALNKLANQALEEKRWKDASDLWTKAYALECSRPRVFKSLGQAFEAGGDVHAAVAMYELLSERAPSEVPEDLPPKIHELRLKAQKLDDAAAPAPTREPTTAPPQNVELERPLGFVPWILVGGGAAIAVGGGVLLGVGQAQAGAAEDECDDPELRTGCPQSAVDDGEAGELMSQIGQGLLYGGVGVAALGLVLQFAANGERPKEVAAGSWQFAVVPQAGGVALTAFGTFE